MKNCYGCLYSFHSLPRRREASASIFTAFAGNINADFHLSTLQLIILHVGYVRTQIGFFVKGFAHRWSQVELIKLYKINVGADSGGFEFFRLRFAQGGVPTVFDSAPDTTRRALSNVNIGLTTYCIIGVHGHKRRLLLYHWRVCMGSTVKVNQWVRSRDFAGGVCMKT